jgi:SAM-dependent methyltransferase
MAQLGLEIQIAARTLGKLINEGLLDKQASVLAVCASKLEHTLFQHIGMPNITISNLDTRSPADAYAPFAWSYQDAEDLSYPDNSFDWAFVHAGLHHCASPHRGLLEMYRVARKGVIVLEARDSLAMRTGVKLGLTRDYELESIILNNMNYGGVRNTPLPNFIYRWTEREFMKAINSFNPAGKHTFRFYHGLRMPMLFAGLHKNPAKKLALQIIKPFFTTFAAIFPSQMNHFAMVAIKPTEKDIFAWNVREKGGYRLSHAYAQEHFKGLTQPAVPEMKPVTMEAINSSLGDPVLPVIIPDRNRTTTKVDK